MAVSIIQGDALEVLRTLPDESVHCCISSPPYWGLRDYGTAKWEGGDSGCDHIPTREKIIAATMMKTGLNTATNGLSENQMAAASARMVKSPCPRCGARRIDSQLGLEKSPEEYVAKMVEVFRKVRRVLHSDGTLWLNLGDSYSGSGKGDGGATRKQTTNAGSQFKSDLQGAIPPGLKPKDLCGIPWRVAFALQADGWYLRQDIIWSKPNPMPESVTDRCTKSHEYIFLLSKSQRYYYDAEAIKEPAECDRLRGSGPMVNSGTGRNDASTGTIGDYRKVRSPAGWKTGKGSHGSIHDQGREQEITYNEINSNSRNKRSVWTVATAPFPGAHFATFPPKLIEPCILAGCPSGGTVLDPFGGSGTVGMVAESNGRNSILIELNPKYVDMARRRTAQQGLFAGAAN